MTHSGLRKSCRAHPQQCRDGIAPEESSGAIGADCNNRSKRYA